MYKNLTTVKILATLALLVSAAPAVAADAHAGHDMAAMRSSHAAALQQVQDRAAIEDLLWRYVRALDTLDADAYVATFAENGQFGTGANAIKGRAAIHKMVTDLAKSRADRRAKGEAAPDTLHVIANHRLTFQDADHAKFESYWMTMYPPQGPGKQPAVGSVGRDVNDLARINGKWLITLRNVAP
jgi:3-phenylpropionate/cinnamic acid dioxygenase small subunit